MYVYIFIYVCIYIYIHRYFRYIPNLFPGHKSKLVRGQGVCLFLARNPDIIVILSEFIFIYWQCNLCLVCVRVLNTIEEGLCNINK